MKKIIKSISCLFMLVFVLSIFPMFTFAASAETPIIITPPDSVIHPVNGVYTTSFGVDAFYDIADMRFASGKLGYSDYENASVVSTTTFDVPASESDQWYTFYVKDVEGNMSFVNFYAHCEMEETCEEDPSKHIVKGPNGDCVCEDGYQMNESGECILIPTPTPTPTPELGCVEDPSKHIVKGPNGDCVCEDGYEMDETTGECIEEETAPVTITPTLPPAITEVPTQTPTPTLPPTIIPTPVPETPGCPDGQTMDANGNCYTPDVSCPEGYVKNVDGICVIAPSDCPEGQVMDVNGNCVEKVTTLPQTGGLDALMLFFLFGCGLGLCGVGVLAYSKVKTKK